MRRLPARTRVFRQSRRCSSICEPSFFATTATRRFHPSRVELPAVYAKSRCWKDSWTRPSTHRTAYRWPVCLRCRCIGLVNVTSASSITRDGTAQMLACLPRADKQCTTVALNRFRGRYTGRPINLDERLMPDPTTHCRHEGSGRWCNGVIACVIQNLQRRDQMHWERAIS